MTRRRRVQKRNGRRTPTLRDYLRQIPSPPKEHEHELKMERLLKRLVRKSRGLSQGELRYYSRQIMLDAVGYDGQIRLKDARVCIVGMGGLGSAVATQLAAMGVGGMRLVDRDIVEESNLQRQHLYDFDVLRLPKVEAAAKRLKKLNPYVRLEPLPVSFSEGNAKELLSEMDVIVDGLDNMNTRYAVNRACVKSGVPYVFGSAISTYGNVCTIVPGVTACLECFYGRLDDSRLPTCGSIGVHPSVISIVASVEATEAVKILLGTKPSLGNKMLYCDVDSMRFEEIGVVRAESCPVCGSRPRGKPSPLKQTLVMEGCGRKNRRVFTVVPKENLGLDTKEVAALLKGEAISIHATTKLGVAFSVEKGVEASILSSGVMVIEGAGDESEALSLYRAIVVNKAGIPWSRIK